MPVITPTCSNGINQAFPSSFAYPFFVLVSSQPYYQHSLKFLLSFLSAIPALFLSFLCPCDYMIKALLPMSQWGSTVIMSDLLNNDHVNALSGWSDWRVLQGHGPAWNITDSGPPFLAKQTHNVYHSDTTKCCCSWVISCWKNIIISLLLGKHFTGSVVSVIVMFGCECVCVCVWPKGSENDLKLWFFFILKGQWDAPAVDEDAWREVLLLF